MSQLLKLDSDAFSTGQIESKIWAARELEKIVRDLTLPPLRIAILGGWYALLHFILKSRENIEIEYCRSYDIDAAACLSANLINNSWEAKNWQFRALPRDANILSYDDQVNLVVNTSTEHFIEDKWFELIPDGTLCLLQGNDLILDDHVNRPDNLDHFKNLWPLKTLLYEGSLYFEFGENSYTRYMVIGKK